MGVRIGPLEDSSLVAVPVGQVRRMVVASPAYLRRHGTPAHPRDLLAANCLKNSFGKPGWGNFHEHGRAFRLNVRGNLEFNHVLPALEACVAGAGFGMFFSYQVAPHIAQKRLQVVLESFEQPPRPIQLVYPHARLLPRRTRVFIDWMRQELKSLQTTIG